MRRKISRRLSNLGKANGARASEVHRQGKLCLSIRKKFLVIARSQLPCGPGIFAS